MLPVQPPGPIQRKSILKTWGFYVLMLSVVLMIVIIILMIHLQSVMDKYGQPPKKPGSKDLIAVHWEGISWDTIKDFTDVGEQDQQIKLDLLKKGLSLLYEKVVEVENRISQLEVEKGNLNNELSKKEKDAPDYEILKNKLNTVENEIALLTTKLSFSLKYEKDVVEVENRISQLEAEKNNLVNELSKKEKDDPDYETLKDRLNTVEDEIALLTVKLSSTMTNNPKYLEIQTAQKNIDKLEIEIKNNKNAYYGLLGYVKKMDQNYLAQNSKEISDIPYENFSKNPQKYRGKLFRITGLVTRVSPIRLEPGNPANVDMVYRVYLDDNYGKECFICDVAEMPPKLKTREETVPIDVDLATTEGVLFKVAEYEARRGNKAKPPIIIARSVQKVDRTTAKRSLSEYGVGIIVLGVIAVIFCVFITFRTHKKNLRDIGHLTRAKRF